MAGPLVAVSSAGKSIALQDLPDSAWRYLAGKGADQDGSVSDVYAKVPWVYRGVNIRAQSISKTPIAILKGDTELWSTDADAPPPKGFEWFAKLPALIDRVERSLCLDGAAYLFKNRNRVKVLGLQYMLPKSVTPKFDPTAGLVSFERRLGNSGKTLEIEDLVYWWLPSVTAELGPGTSPVAAALLSAGLIQNIDSFAKGFFDRGATPLTLLSVEGNPPDAELRRLENWWKRTLAGVRRAFETVAVRASIEPKVIGGMPKDLGMETLTASKRQDVATCLGVPYSILFSEASNFATAQQDEWNLWTLALKPEAEMIEDGFNEQLFGPLGLRLKFQFQRLEVFQRREDQKAYEDLALVMGGVMTPKELRDRLDLEELDDPDINKLRKPMSIAPDGSVPRTNGGMQRDLSKQLGVTRQSQGARPGEGKALELAQWERKALKALKAGQPANVVFEFKAFGDYDQTSEHDRALLGSIDSALRTATTPEEVKAAFSAAPFRGLSYP
jgi:HK97 family phage portal protein